MNIRRSASLHAITGFPGASCPPIHVAYHLSRIAVLFVTRSSTQPSLPAPSERLCETRLRFGGARGSVTRSCDMIGGTHTRCDRLSGPRLHARATSTADPQDHRQRQASATLTRLCITHFTNAARSADADADASTTAEAEEVCGTPARRPQRPDPEADRHVAEAHRPRARARCAGRAGPTPAPRLVLADREATAARESLATLSHR